LLLACHSEQESTEPASIDVWSKSLMDEAEAVRARALENGQLSAAVALAMTISEIRHNC
jgi:hypothetical protein